MKMDGWIVDDFSFGTKVPKKEPEKESEDDD